MATCPAESDPEVRQALEMPRPRRGPPVTQRSLVAALQRLPSDWPAEPRPRDAVGLDPLVTQGLALHQGRLGASAGAAALTRGVLVSRTRTREPRDRGRRTRPRAPCDFIGRHGVRAVGRTSG